MKYQISKTELIVIASTFLVKAGYASYYFFIIGRQGALGTIVVNFCLAMGTLAVMKKKILSKYCDVKNNVKNQIPRSILGALLASIDMIAVGLCFKLMKMWNGEGGESFQYPIPSVMITLLFCLLLIFGWKKLQVKTND